MKYPILIGLMSLSIISNSWAQGSLKSSLEINKHLSQISGGVVNGGGGGGVIRNGVPQTFYSAGFYVDPTPMQSESIPGLNSLMNFIRNDPSMSMMLKSNLLQLLVPTNGRSYYRVTEEEFNRETLQQIVKEYVKATKAPQEDIAVYAITKDSTTYLLPNFFKLQSETQMQAILLHELLWVASKNRTYQQVIQAEMAAQAFLEDSKNLRKKLSFAYYFGAGGDFQPKKQSADYVQSAFAVDLFEGNLAGLVQTNNAIAFKDIVGPGFFNCEGCTSNMVDINLYELRQKYPRSEFLKAFTPSTLMFSENGKSVENCKGNFGNNFNCIYLNDLDANKKNVLIDDRNNKGVKVDFARCSISLAPKFLIQNPYPLSVPSDTPRPFTGLPASCPGLPQGLFLNVF